MYLKKSHDQDEDFSVVDFLIKPSKVFPHAEARILSRKKGIADKLCVLMPADRR